MVLILPRLVHASYYIEVVNNDKEERRKKKNEVGEGGVLRRGKRGGIRVPFRT